jgi:hypothetical protein
MHSTSSDVTSGLSLITIPPRQGANAHVVRVFQLDHTVNACPSGYGMTQNG